MPDCSWEVARVSKEIATKKAPLTLRVSMCSWKESTIVKLFFSICSKSGCQYLSYTCHSNHLVHGLFPLAKHQYKGEFAFIKPNAAPLIGQGGNVLECLPQKAKAALKTSLNSFQRPSDILVLSIIQPNCLQGRTLMNRQPGLTRNLRSRTRERVVFWGGGVILSL